MGNSPQDVLKGVSVLFAEDDPLEQEMIGELLEHYFLRVHRADNGEEALEIFEKDSTIRVIIADIFMEKMNGLELIRTIRNRGSNIPALVITNEKTEELLMEAVTLKLSGYILKPISLQTLKSGLENCRREITEQQLTRCIPLTKQISFDPGNATLINGGNPCELNTKEYKFLLLAIKYKNMLLTRDMIQEHVWENGEMSDAALKNFLHRLRSKVGKDTIVSIKGLGVKLVTDPGVKTI